MDRTKRFTVLLDLEHTTPTEAAFLQILPRIKGLQVSTTKLQKTADLPTVSFRDLQIEGTFPITLFLDRTIPSPPLYVNDPARDAILDSLTKLIISEFAPLEVASGCYSSNPSPRFLCDAKAPTLLDIAVVAAVTAGNTSAPDWARPMLGHFQEWISEHRPRARRRRVAEVAI